MRFVTILLTLHLFSTYTVSPNKNFVIEHESFSEDAIVLGKFLINYHAKYIDDNETFVSFILGPSINSEFRFQEDFFRFYFSDSIPRELPITILWRLDDTLKYKRSAFNVIFVENSESLKDILSDTAVKSFHVKQKFLIVLGKMATPEAFNDIFEILWNHRFFNSQIFSLSEPNIWSLDTFMPFGGNCSVLERVTITSFSAINCTEELKIPMDDHYPPKLKNLKQCRVDIGVVMTNPFIIRRKDQLRGIDIDLLTHISEALNFSIGYKTSPEGHGNIFDNLTCTGNMNLIINGEVNLAVGGYILSDKRLKLFSASVPYMQGSAGFAFKMSDTSSSLTRLAAPFDMNIWILIGSILLLSIPIILGTRLLSSHWRHFYIGGRLNRTPVLNMLATVLGSPITNRHILNGKHLGTFARTLLIFWIILWLVIRSSYQGALYKNLQSRQLTSNCDTIHKIRTSDCTIVVPNALSFSLNGSFSSDRVIRKETELSALIRTAYDFEPNTVTFATDIMLKALNLQYPNRRLTFTKDRLFMYSPVILFPKKSALVEEFNDQLYKLREGGLIDYWNRKYLETSKLGSKQNDPIKLQMSHIRAAFQMCGILYFISFIVFILELISVKCLWIKKLLDYFTY